MGVTITMGMQIEGKIGILFSILSAVFGQLQHYWLKMGWFIGYMGAISLSNAFGGLLLLMASFVLEQPFLL